MVEFMTLKVREALQSDVGLGRARIDAKSRLALGLVVGDIVEILGSKRSAAKLLPLSKEREGRRVLRVDGVMRRNFGASIGDKVKVRKAEVFPAERVTIAPIISEGHKISFGEGIESSVKRGLLKRPLTQGDVVIVPGISLIGGTLPFMVVKVVPDGIVQVRETTTFELSDRPARESGELVPDYLNFRHALVLVRDLERSLAFYETLLGFEAASVEQGSVRSRVRLSSPNGTSTITLRVTDSTEAFRPSQGVVLYFEVEALDPLLDRLRAAGTAIVQSPEVVDVGRIEALVRDPDGHLVGLFSARRGPLGT